MRRSIRSLASAIALLGASASGAAAGQAAVPPPPPVVAEVQLRVINHRFVSAFFREDGDFMESLTDQDFLLTTNSGDWLGRAEHIKSMRSPAGLAAFPIVTWRSACSARWRCCHGTCSKQSCPAAR